MAAVTSCAAAVPLRTGRSLLDLQGKISSCLHRFKVHNLSQ